MSTRRRSRTAVIATPVAERSLLELRRDHPVYLGRVLEARFVAQAATRPGRT